jgi:hypothetical protein
VLGTSALSTFVLHFTSMGLHLIKWPYMIIHLHTQSVKVHSPTALTFYRTHITLKPYIYLQINTRGAAIKALSIFMDYIK